MIKKTYYGITKVISPFFTQDSLRLFFGKEYFPQSFNHAIIWQGRKKCMCHIDSEMRHQEPNRYRKWKALMVIPRKWQFSLTSLLQPQLCPTTCPCRLCQPTLVSHGKFVVLTAHITVQCLSFLLAVTSTRARIISNLSNCCSPVARTVLSTQEAFTNFFKKTKGWMNYDTVREVW